ncbi:MAG: metalloregulator ArsR/SmtB family transcription factor [Pseudomonadota bacterium]
MKEGPDITRIAALLGDPARANMLAALMSGKALTASELAREAGVTPQTASSHLKKLEAGGLTATRAQGRHRYVTLAGEDVADLLERLTGLAAASGHLRTRTGPRDPDMRLARVCYNHLAGQRAVALYGALCSDGLLTVDADGLALTDAGRARMVAFGVDVAGLEAQRGPLCKECLDWSERRSHLGGRLGRAVYTAMEARGWVTREAGSRTVRFSKAGARAFDEFWSLNVP